MSKIVQRATSTALRVRSMSSLPEKNISPEKLADWGRKVNPAQTVYGPKDPKLEKWQKFFQDPLNVEKPVFMRKGAIDEILVSALTVVVAGGFIYNIYLFKNQ